MKALREERQWSQEELARKIDANRVTIAKLEAGTRKPSVKMLENLADQFRLSLADLLKLPRRARRS